MYDLYCIPFDALYNGDGEKKIPAPVWGQLSHAVGKRKTIPGWSRAYQTIPKALGDPPNHPAMCFIASRSREHSNMGRKILIVFLSVLQVEALENIYSSIGSHYHLNEIDNMDEKTIKKIWRQRTAVLNAYPPDEILEIYSSVCFLRGLLEKLMEDELTWTGDEVCGKPGKRAITTYSLMLWGSEDDIFDDDNKLFSVTSCARLRAYGRIGRYLFRQAAGTV
ncbi:hypothetical protein B0H14DRAFT_2599697 [Mycena olivaceomarginata]|nr:hypothetical protein B0H14DRAFT_2599697 [Mycena olivaceomarginata]